MRYLYPCVRGGETVRRTDYMRLACNDYKTRRASVILRIAPRSAMPAEAPPRRARAPNPRGPRSRTYCFTLNNYTQEEIQALLDCIALGDVKG